MNTNHHLSFTRSARSKIWRFNPLTHLQSSQLSRMLDSFEAGHLREAVAVWDALEQRDDLLRGVISKRKKSVARHGWTVLPKAGLPELQAAEARAHVSALQFFYQHLECEHAVDTAEKGGFKLLARQMMDAVGKRFAVHEIVWQRAGEGSSGGQVHRTAGVTHQDFVTAKFRFVPLGFFENTTGRLRFLESESAREGSDLEPGAWMVTVGEGLMVASATAWMFKHLALDDWLRCSQRNGMPILRGVSSSARDSAEWNALSAALDTALDDKESIIHSSSDSVDVLNLMSSGHIPFPALVERIDRMLAALWRGADLSTISRDRGYGASLQEKETCVLEEDDAEMLTETLNQYVDAWVIRHVFGAEARPLAQVKVLVAPRECTTSDLQVDEFLLRHGAPLSLQETLSRYGRALPRPGETILMVRPAQNHTALEAPTQVQNELRGRASIAERSQNPAEGGGMSNDAAILSGMPNESAGPVVNLRGALPDDAEAEAEVLPLHDGAANGESASLANRFTLLQEDWIQISPFGEFPHARGLQRVDRAAAEAMVAQFTSFRGRLGRLFGGVPFFVGHPDLSGASEWVDRKAYGWINELAAREDGLYGLVKWSEAGLEILRNAHFKYLSPYWEAREIGTENGRRIYRPVVLLSVGLTNQPNIPVKPLANECRNETAQESLPRSFPVMHTESCTESLRLRKSELVRLQNRRDRIQEAVLAKVRLGLSYDDAWESVKREHPTWFAST